MALDIFDVTGIDAGGDDFDFGLARVDGRVRQLLDRQILKFVSERGKTQSFHHVTSGPEKRGWTAVGKPAGTQGAETESIPCQDRIYPEPGTRKKERGSRGYNTPCGFVRMDRKCREI
jgi:hypothetical protein